MCKDPEIENLRRCLTYDSFTGIFRWSVEVKNGNVVRRRVGDVAGSIDKSNGYRRIRVSKKDYHAHRLAWLFDNGEWPREQIDHINGDRADNRIANLRQCNQSQNNANARKRRDNRSGFKGVCWDKKKRKWKAEAAVDGRRKFLGYFINPLDAHAAYCLVTQAHYGEFARAK